MLVCDENGSIDRVPSCIVFVTELTAPILSTTLGSVLIDFVECSVLYLKLFTFFTFSEYYSNT